MADTVPPVPSPAFEPKAAAFEPREIVGVVRDRGRGWLVEFDCGDVVWFAIKVERGERHTCSRCVDREMQALRAATASGNLAGGARCA